MDFLNLSNAILIFCILPQKVEKLKIGRYIAMETSKMKNMVVLKNLPSNLVEEAIVILKSSKKVKKLEKIEKNHKVEKINSKPKEQDYILKEAEILISSYISKLEESHEQKQVQKIKNNKKYNRLKNYAYLTSIVILIQAVLLIIK